MRGSVCHGAGHLDVEQYFAVRAVGCLIRHVAGAINTLRGHRGDGKAQAGEVAVQVGVRVAAAKLDDPYRLPGAVGSGRELIDLGHLGRRVGGPGRGGVGASWP